MLLTKGPGPHLGGSGNIGAVNLGMTIRAAVQEQPLYPGSIVQRVAAVTLEAEERHGGIEQVVVYRTMRGVAVGAVFGDVAMLEQKRPLFFHVAPGTGLFRRTPPQQFVLCRPMRVVAVDARHFLFPQRVMRKEIGLHLHLGMAAEAELSHLLPFNFLLWSLVEFVAVEAAHIVKGMGAGIPIGEVWCRDC